MRHQFRLVLACMLLFAGAVGVCVYLHPWHRPIAHGDGSSGFPLMFESEEVSAGDLLVGVRHSVRMGFRNVSQVPTRIEELKSGCDCSGESSFPHEWIMPGKEASIDLAIVPKAKKQRADFHLKLTGGMERVLRVRYEGRLDIILSTTTVRFGDIVAGTQVSRDVEILRDSTSTDPLAVEVVEKSAPWIAVEYVPKPTLESAPAKGSSAQRSRSAPDMVRSPGRLHVRVTANAPLGAFAEKALLSVTDCKGTRKIVISCGGTVVEEIRVLPSPIIYRNGDNNLVMVRSAGRPFAVTRISSDVAECAAEPLESARMEMVIRLPKWLDTTRKAGSLTLEFGEPERRKINIPLLLGAAPQALP